MLTPALILLRGLPGSGKSELAVILSENGKYPVHSIDQYFTESDGRYNFRFEDNHLAYNQCELNTISSLQKGIEKVFVDNTFTLEWEMEPYFKMAERFNYYLFVLTVENRHGNKNIHQVTDEQLQKMAEKYQVVLI